MGSSALLVYRTRLAGTNASPYASKEDKNTPPSKEDHTGPSWRAIEKTWPPYASSLLRTTNSAANASTTTPPMT